MSVQKMALAKEQQSNESTSEESDLGLPLKVGQIRGSCSIL